MTNLTGFSIYYFAAEENGFFFFLICEKTLCSLVLQASLILLVSYFSTAMGKVRHEQSKQ